MLLRLSHPRVPDRLVAAQLHPHLISEVRFGRAARSSCCHHLSFDQPRNCPGQYRATAAVCLGGVIGSSGASVPAWLPAVSEASVLASLHSPSGHSRLLLCASIQSFHGSAPSPDRNHLKPAPEWAPNRPRLCRISPIARLGTSLNSVTWHASICKMFLHGWHGFHHNILVAGSLDHGVERSSGSRVHTADPAVPGGQERSFGSRVPDRSLISSYIQVRAGCTPGYASHPRDKRSSGSRVITWAQRPCASVSFVLLPSHATVHIIASVLRLTRPV